MRIITILPGAFASGIVFALLACSTAPTTPPAVAIQLPAPQQAQEFICTNDSLFSLSLRRNSYGGAEVGVIGPLRSERISYRLDRGSELVFYPLYRVPLTRKVVLSTEIDRSRFFLRKSWDIAEEVVIPAPEHFEDDAVYLILTNKSGSAISLMRRQSFLPLVSDTPATTLNVGETGVYKTTASGMIGLSLYHSEIPVPQHTWQDGYVYTLIFDGEFIELIDERPLHRVGEPMLAVVDFQGNELAASEQALFVQAINKRLEETNTPARIVDASDAGRQQQLSSYTFVVTLNTAIQPPRPPANYEEIAGELSLTFMRNSTVLAHSEKRFVKQLTSAAVYRAARAFVEAADAFYRAISNAIML
jgi:hypothetical protein